MNKILLPLIFMCLTQIMLGQQVFNLLPQISATLNQSKIFASTYDSTWIYTVGDLLDSSQSNKNNDIVPWFGKFDYSGNLVLETKIIIQELPGRISIYDNLAIKFNNEELLYYGSYFDTNGITNGILLSINTESGDINNYNIISSPVKNKHLFPRYSRIERTDSTIILVSLTEINSRTTIYITTLDYNLNIINETPIALNNRDNQCFYLEKDESNNYVLIGSSSKLGDLSAFPDIQPFRMVANQSGDILEFKLAPNVIDKTVVFEPGTNTIYKIDNNWIFTCLSLIKTGACTNCYYSIPKIYNVSGDFITLFWETYSSEPISNDSQLNIILSANLNVHDQTYLLSGAIQNLHFKGSYLTKLNSNGEILWNKYYIPVDWNKENVSWAFLNSINFSPYNTIIGTGQAINSSDALWKSWIIQVDEDGCLVPNCDMVSNNNLKENKLSNTLITIFPNPAQNFIILDYSNLPHADYYIELINNKGQLLKSVKTYLTKDTQYVFDVSFLLPSEYYILVKSKNNDFIMSSPFIKL